MLSKKIEEAFAKQIQDEFYSSQLYLAMSAFSTQKNFLGFAHWMKLQAQEESGHAIKIFDYILERGGNVLLKEIPKPQHDFKSIRAMVETAFEHELKVSASINKLYELAGSEKDFASQIMLQWFIKEQVEEEALFTEVLNKIKMIPDSGSALLYLDKSMMKRGEEK